MIPGCTNTRLYRWTGAGAEQANALPDWLALEAMERKYLVLLLARQVAIDLAQPLPARELVECVEHPEWGVMDIVAAARRAGPGKNPSKVRHAINTGRRCGAVHWCRPGERDGYVTRPIKVHSLAEARPVVCVETGTVYPTARLAAQAVGCQPQSVYNACRDGCNAGGVHWRYQDDANPPALRSSGHKPIQCVETGKVFKTIKAAAEKLKVSKHTLSEAANTGAACRGYHWRFVEAAANNPRVEAAQPNHPAPDAPRPHPGSPASTPAPQRARRVGGGSSRAQMTASNGIARQGEAA